MATAVVRAGCNNFRRALGMQACQRPGFALAGRLFAGQGRAGWLNGPSPVKKHQAVGPRQVQAGPSSSGGQQEDLWRSAGQAGLPNPHRVRLGTLIGTRSS